MAAKNNFTKWQREESQTEGNAVDAPGKPMDLRWRASGRSLRRQKYNASQLEAQRDAVVFRWAIGIITLLAVVGTVIYIAHTGK